MAHTTLRRVHLLWFYGVQLSQVNRHFSAHVTQLSHKYQHSRKSRGKFFNIAEALKRHLTKNIFQFFSVFSLIFLMFFFIWIIYSWNNRTSKKIYVCLQSRTALSSSWAFNTHKGALSSGSACRQRRTLKIGQVPKKKKIGKDSGTRWRYRRFSLGLVILFFSPRIREGSRGPSAPIVVALLWIEPEGFVLRLEWKEEISFGDITVP